MNLIALPALTDNYIWILHDGRQALVVDPGENVAVRRTLAALNLELAGILVTHHHHDHVDGIHGLRDLLRGQVHGPATEFIPPPCEPVHDGQTVTVADWRFHVMSLPGHTKGHVGYVLESRGLESALVFCGDTLFSGSCGRLFEGTPAQMFHSLKRLATLAPSTLVCCTHEYTVANMKFACVVEPSNQRAIDYSQWCELQRREGRPTLPSSIGLEREINPFLRCNQTEVVRSARDHAGLSDLFDDGSDGELAVFTVLRQWKNEFRT